MPICTICAVFTYWNWKKLQMFLMSLWILDSNKLTLNKEWEISISSPSLTIT